MTDQQWKRALELYETAAELPEFEAQALLRSSTDEPAVLQEVSEILESHDKLEQTPNLIAPSRFAGAVVGRYHLTSLLGRGSTGEVYQGRDPELNRPVALKINRRSTPPRLRRLSGLFANRKLPPR